MTVVGVRVAQFLWTADGGRRTLTKDTIITSTCWVCSLIPYLPREEAQQQSSVAQRIADLLFARSLVASCACAAMRTRLPRAGVSAVILFCERHYVYLEACHVRNSFDAVEPLNAK